MLFFQAWMWINDDQDSEQEINDKDQVVEVYKIEDSND